MYTEDNEFDYNEYDNKNGNGNSYFNKGLITKIILIVICLVIIIFLFFKVKNLKNDNTDYNNNDNIALVFDNNVILLRNAGEQYFFGDGNYPTSVGEEKSANITTLRGSALTMDINDYDGNKCGYNTSLVSVTRNAKDYEMKIYLSCPSKEDTVTYYYNLDFECLTCNGETYVEPEDEEDNNEDDENNDDNQDNNPIQNVCGEFGEWTTTYIEDPTLEREQRTVIKAYKDNNIYGEWSPLTTTKIEPNANLEVKTVDKQETISTYPDSWIDNGTSKPSSKEGREIKTSTSREPYSSTSCRDVQTTYTKIVPGGDKNVPCTRVPGSMFDYKCTYTKTEKKCTTTTKYKTVTYYKYRDKVDKQETVTYYQSRTITKGTPTYTDYILESEIPSGYQKVPNSELVQYRYREKCSK